MDRFRMVRKDKGRDDPDKLERPRELELPPELAIAPELNLSPKSLKKKKSKKAQDFDPFEDPLSDDAVAPKEDAVARPVRGRPPLKRGKTAAELAPNGIE